MTSVDSAGARMAEVEKAILDRAPEHDLVPTLDRIADVCSLLGAPQNAFRAAHVTGTNGTTTTARIVQPLPHQHAPGRRARTDRDRRGCADAAAVRRHLRGRGPVRRPRRPTAGARRGAAV